MIRSKLRPRVTALEFIGHAAVILTFAAGAAFWLWVIPS